MRLSEPMSGLDHDVLHVNPVGSKRNVAITLIFPNSLEAPSY